VNLRCLRGFRLARLPLPAESERFAQRDGRNNCRGEEDHDDGRPDRILRSGHPKCALKSGRIGPAAFRRGTQRAVENAPQPARNPGPICRRRVSPRGPRPTADRFVEHGGNGEEIGCQRFGRRLTPGREDGPSSLENDGAWCDRASPEPRAACMCTFDRRQQRATDLRGFSNGHRPRAESGRERFACRVHWCAKSKSRKRPRHPPGPLSLSHASTTEP